jgi:hypothetical protein
LEEVRIQKFTDFIFPSSIFDELVISQSWDGKEKSSKSRRATPELLATILRTGVPPAVLLGMPQ